MDKMQETIKMFEKKVESVAVDHYIKSKREKLIYGWHDTIRFKEMLVKHNSANCSWVGREN